VSRRDMPYILFPLRVLRELCGPRDLLISEFRVPSSELRLHPMREILRLRSKTHFAQDDNLRLPTPHSQLPIPRLTAGAFLSRLLAPDYRLPVFAFGYDAASRNCPLATHSDVSDGTSCVSRPDEWCEERQAQPDGHRAAGDTQHRPAAPQRQQRNRDARPQSADDARRQVQSLQKPQPAAENMPHKQQRTQRNERYHTQLPFRFFKIISNHFTS
jgi:hypothetical protein